MGVEREIFRLEMFSGLVIGEVVQQDGAQNGAFRFHVSGKAVRETVVGSGQCLFICGENSRRGVSAILAAFDLWTPRDAFGKRRSN